MEVTPLRYPLHILQTALLRFTYRRRQFPDLSAYLHALFIYD